MYHYNVSFEIFTLEHLLSMEHRFWLGKKGAFSHIYAYVKCFLVGFDPVGGGFFCMSDSSELRATWVVYYSLCFVFSAGLRIGKRLYFKLARKLIVVLVT